MGYTIEMQVDRFGTWHLTNMVFASFEEAAHHADDAARRWPDLVARWTVVDTDAPPTHTWSTEDGLTPIRQP